MDGGESRAGALRADRLTETVAAALVAHLPARAHVAVALSGGRDSVALLDAVATLSSRLGLRVSAFHVHHGLSRHADDWERFCAELCAARGIAFVTGRVAVNRAPRASLEAAARRARYAALAEAARAHDVDAVLLAHHQDDQAETTLLQLLRGAGPAGLAAMPQVRVDARGVAWLRPLLGVPRAAIDAYAVARGLAWIDDDSNADARFARNALRLDVVPRLRLLAPGYPAAVARAAALQAEAALLADDLATVDAAGASDGATLDRAALAALPPHRARNLLRWFLRAHGLPPPAAARLAAMHAQLARARDDARVRVAHAGVELGVHRGRIVVHRAPPAPYACAWHGEPELPLPHGTLAFVAVTGDGVDAQRLRRGHVCVRSRSGGERLRLAAARPRRALKALLREASVPPWERLAWPVVYCDGELACVPGVGVDIDYRAAPGAPGLALVWRADRGEPARPATQP
jgi:tRNA(Ile)-lysidine synthase